MFNKHKRQIALVELKSRREELKRLQTKFEKLYVRHARWFGKDPNKVPRNAYSNLIEERVAELTKLIDQMEFENKLIADGEKLKEK